MGTVSENQTQEHNKEKNRPGRKDLEAGVKSKENAPARLKGQLRDQKGPWTCCGCGVPALEPQGPARPRFGQEPRACGSFLPPSPLPQEGTPGPTLDPAGRFCPDL